MARKKLWKKRESHPDPKYGDFVVARFISTVMRGGNKSLAERMLYGAFEIIQKKIGQNGVDVFKKALDSVKPALEVKSRRVGGATYQVPIEVSSDRQRSLASRWIVEAARARGEHSMMEKLAGEFMDAVEGRGGAMKKKEDVHRMAEANRAFAHFRW